MFGMFRKFNGWIMSMETKASRAELWVIVYVATYIIAVTGYTPLGNLELLYYMLNLMAIDLGIVSVGRIITKK